MKFHSTRGTDSGRTFRDVLFRACAKDGGMYLPETIVPIEKDTIRQWVHLSYPELAYQVVSRFLTEEDIPAQDLKDILQKSYSAFDVPEVIPVTHLANSLVIMELFHGPSFSFKDLSMFCLARILNYFLAKENECRTLMISTSGDTGSSAIEAMQGLSNIDLIVMLPRGRISPIQERQMTTALGKNVHVVRIDGSSDDSDTIVSAIFSDPEFVSTHRVGSASSINFCRIMVQMVHIFYSYLKLCPEVDQEVELILPTGGGGNITGGTIARKLGLPVRFTCAVNHNNVLSRFMETGECDIGEVECTHAPAMDIQFAYNLERMWFMCNGGNSQEIKKVMDQVSASNKVNLSPTIMENLRQYVRVHTVKSNKEIEAVMKKCWDENKYSICPHTAIGVSAYYSIIDQTGDQANHIPRAVLATASPVKFPEAAKSAGIPVATCEALDKLMTAPTKHIDLEKGQDWVAAIKTEIEKITERRNALK